MASDYHFSAPGLLLRTITHTFDFSGHSTRTEVLLWFLVMPLFAVAAHWAILPLLTLDYAVEKKIWDGLILLFYVPFVALFARRLNDQDRARWWLLLLPLGLVDEALGLFANPPDLPAWIMGGMNLIAVIGIFGLLFLEGSTADAKNAGANPAEPEPT